jgi:hypothetical protein
MIPQHENYHYTICLEALDVAKFSVWNTSGLGQGLVVGFCGCGITFSIRTVLSKINKDGNKYKSFKILKVKVGILLKNEKSSSTFLHTFIFLHSLFHLP